MSENLLRICPQYRRRLPHFWLNASQGGGQAAHNKWEGDQDMRNGNSDIYVSWAAWPVGEWLPAQRVNQDIGTAEQFSPDVAIDRWGNTTVVWSDERNPSSAPDIYARFIPAGERFRLFLPGVAKP